MNAFILVCFIIQALKTFLIGCFSNRRTLKAFELWLKKGTRSTDYIFPSEMLVMMNVIVDFKNQVSEINKTQVSTINETQVSQIN